MPRHAAILVDPLFASEEVRAQADHWARALEHLGFTTRRADAADPRDVARALDNAEVALVENVCSVPAHPAAAHAAVNALSEFAERGGRVVFHHHDLPWQPDWSNQPDLGLPPRLLGATHVGISLRARQELQARAYGPVVAVHQHFDFVNGDGDRDATRAAHGFGDDDIVLYQPTRATRTTNVAGAVRYLRALEAVIKNRPLRYWLRGPIDDDVAPTVTRLLERCPVPVTIADASPHDALAASDVMLLPSTWDPSGAAAVEAVIARRPCVVGPFPVLGELNAIGLRFFALDEPMELVKHIARARDGAVDRLSEVNLRRAQLSFDALEQLPTKVADVLALAGVPL